MNYLHIHVMLTHKLLDYYGSNINCGYLWVLKFQVNTFISPYAYLYHPLLE